MGGRSDKMDKLLKALHKKKYGDHDRVMPRRFESPRIACAYDEELYVCAPIPRIRDVRECPNAEDLSAFVDDTLDPAARKNVELHISQCKECAAQVKSASESVGRFRDGSIEKAPEAISKKAAPWLPRRSRKSGKPPKKS